MDQKEFVTNLLELIKDYVGDPPRNVDIFCIVVNEERMTNVYGYGCKGCMVEDIIEHKGQFLHNDPSHNKM